MSGRGQSSKSRKKVKNAAAAGTAGAKSRRRRPPPKKSSSKPMMIGVAVILLISAVVAIVVVVSGGGDSFEVSQEQFSGDIQLEDSEEELIEWSDDLNDLSSQKAKALVEKIKPKLASAMEAEGFNLDEVQITSLTPDEPRDVTRSEKALNIPASDLAGRIRSVNTYTQTTYKNIRPVNIKYKTFGKPSKNAAVMGSVHSADTWRKVGGAISTRMRSNGFTATVRSLEPKEEFVNSVYKEIRASPGIITTVSPPKMDVRKITLCNPISSVENIDSSENEIFECTTTCKDEPQSAFIYGGHNDIFNSFTATCTAAYAAGFINDEAKGLFQVIPQGIGFSKNRTESEPIQGDWVKMKKDPFLSTLFKIKGVGSVITPTEPPPPPDLEEHQFSPMNDPVNRWATTTNVRTPTSEIGTADTLMVVYMDVYVPTWPTRRPNPATFYRGDSSDARSYREDIGGNIITELNDYGFKSVQYEGFFPCYGTEDRMAMYLTINDNEANFVQVINKLNGMRYGGFAKQMLHDMELNTKRRLGSLRLTKKGKDALEK